MAITIKMKQEKWIIEIREEEFEMETFEGMQKVLEDILMMKNKFGKLQNRKYE